MSGSTPRPARRHGRGPLAGRIVLLVGAYSPVALMIAARALPHTAGWVALMVGVFGLGAWGAFLRWLPNHQPRTAPVVDLEPIDSEVTGYIVSLLLPVIAAADPNGGEIVAYAICGALILMVAFLSDLSIANPLIYLSGYRVARATVDGERTIILVDDTGPAEGDVTVIRAVGVTYVPDA